MPCSPLHAPYRWHSTAPLQQKWNLFLSISFFFHLQNTKPTTAKAKKGAPANSLFFSFLSFSFHPIAQSGIMDSNLWGECWSPCLCGFIHSHQITVAEEFGFFFLYVFYIWLILTSTPHSLFLSLSWTVILPIWGMGASSSWLLLSFPSRWWLRVCWEMGLYPFTVSALLSVKCPLTY